MVGTHVRGRPTSIFSQRKSHFRTSQCWNCNHGFHSIAKYGLCGRRQSTTSSFMEWRGSSSFFTSFQIEPIQCINCATSVAECATHTCDSKLHSITHSNNDRFLSIDSKCEYGYHFHCLCFGANIDSCGGSSFSL